MLELSYSIKTLKPVLISYNIESYKFVLSKQVFKLIGNMSFLAILIKKINNCYFRFFKCDFRND